MKKIKKQGMQAWGEKNNWDAEIDSPEEQFLIDVLAQSWTPQKGKMIELGCGTAPMLRWFCRKGYSCLGVDISKTAISAGDTPAILDA